MLFANDTTVSKGMVKYACGIPKESIVDVEGIVTVPETPIESCSQKDVSCARAGACAHPRCMHTLWERQKRSCSNHVHKCIQRAVSARLSCK